MTIDEVRALFPVLERVAYLNAGTFGPLAQPTLDAMEAELRVGAVEGRIGKPYFERILAIREQLRERLAGLVGVGPAQVSLTGSTTDGCNIVVAGLDLGPDDEVVTTSDEHPGLILPLHVSGARVVVAAPEPEAILSAITPRTKLIALSHVLWTTGRVLPVHDLREQSGLPILVDGAQSIGAIEVDARGLDYYTISGQKWLCGPDSTGGLIVADPDRLPIRRPSYFAQTSFEPDGSFEPREGAARFDPSWLSASSLAGLLAALEIAPEGRYTRAAEQAARCRALLEPLVELVPGDATLVSFRVDDPPAVVAHLLERDVHVRDIPGTGLVRASVGWWTSDADLERLVSGVRENAPQSSSGSPSK
jgi:L-cysteine/cystine lyase